MGTTMETKRAEFRRYLERSGVVEALTRALIALYSVQDKPDDPIAFVKNNLIENESDPGGLLDQLEGALHRVHELEQELMGLQQAAGLPPDTNVTFAQETPSEQELSEGKKEMPGEESQSEELEIESVLKKEKGEPKVEKPPEEVEKPPEEVEKPPEEVEKPPQEVEKPPEEVEKPPEENEVSKETTAEMPEPATDIEKHSSEEEKPEEEDIPKLEAEDEVMIAEVEILAAEEANVEVYSQETELELVVEAEIRVSEQRSSEVSNEEKLGSNTDSIKTEPEVIDEITKPDTAEDIKSTASEETASDQIATIEPSVNETEPIKEVAKKDKKEKREST